MKTPLLLSLVFAVLTALAGHGSEAGLPASGPAAAGNPAPSITVLDHNSLWRWSMRAVATRKPSDDNPYKDLEVYVSRRQRALK